MTSRYSTAGALAALALVAAVPAQAIDVAPGDYAILPAGTNAGLLYLQHSHADTLDIKDVGEVPDSGLDASVAVLRQLYYTKVGRFPAGVQAVVPIGRFPSAEIEGERQSTSEGFGDITLGMTFWPIQPSNPETGPPPLGLTAFLTVPSGRYDFSDVSMGTGAWVLTPQAGFIQGLGGGFYFDGTVDAALGWYHEEAEVTVSRDPSYKVQAAFRMQPSPKYSASLGYSGQFGGKIEVDGEDTGLQTRRDQLRLYGNAFVTPSIQVQGLSARDLNVEGGFKNDFVAEIRLLKLF